VTDPGRLVTPVVLTANEAPNIGRTLESLTWAHRVVVLDSGSTDRTGDIARTFANVSWHVRRFDRHAAQWEHAVHATGIDTEFALALDADHVVTPAFLRELRERFLAAPYGGAIAPFEYRVFGRSLGGSLYPPRVVIFRPRTVRIQQTGHTQRFAVDEPCYRFSAPLVHDDRKPLERFVASQVAYSRLESLRLVESNNGGRLADRLRRAGFMPPIAWLVAWLRSGGPFGGAAARHYAAGRAAYEALLAMRLVEGALASPPEETAGNTENTEHTDLEITAENAGDAEGRLDGFSAPSATSAVRRFPR
jgi:hypothetical protein